MPFDPVSFAIGAKAGAGGGGSGGILVVNMVAVDSGAKNTKGSVANPGPAPTPTSYRLDKTWREITSADYAVCKVTGGPFVYYLLLTRQGADTEQDTTNYIVSFLDQFETLNYDFVTDSPDGYPVMAMDE